MEKNLLVKIEIPFHRHEWVELEFNKEGGKNNQPIYKSKSYSRVNMAVWNKEDEPSRKDTNTGNQH